MDFIHRFICITCVILMATAVILPVSGAIKFPVTPLKGNLLPTPVPSVNPGSWESQPVNTVHFWVWTSDGEFAVARAGLYTIGKSGSKVFIGQADQNGYLAARLPAGTARVQADSPVYSRNGKSWYYSGTTDVKVAPGNTTAEIRLKQKHTISPPPTVPGS